MRLLLNTCKAIWATLSPSALSSEAATLIGDEGNEILVSAATAWEIATKVRRGRLPAAVALEQIYLEIIAKAGYAPIPIDTASALRAGRLVGFHRHPFDRMIAAQALGLDIQVISPDTLLDEFSVRRIW